MGFRRGLSGRRPGRLEGPCLFKCCIQGGFYPVCFKLARVVHIFKGGPMGFSNYRPVSVLPVLSQLFKRVLKVRLVEYLERHEGQHDETFLDETLDFMVHRTEDLKVSTRFLNPQ